LTWQAVAPPANCNINSYNIYGGTAPNPATLIASGVTGTTYSNAGLAASTKYYYLVEAVDSYGPSAVSQQASATTPAYSVIAPPTSLTAVGSSYQQIDLRWVASTAPAANTAPVNYSIYRSTYYIYRSTTSPFMPATSTLIGTTKSNWFQDALCAASTQYYYQVLANNTIGVSPSSTTVTATTLALNPNLWGGAPFWDASDIPALPAGDTLMVKFLNRTNGKYTDAQIIYTATINGNTVNSTIAENPTYAMGANSSGRMYFFLNDPTVDEDNTDYWDYIEFTVGPTSINMDTTRVDALGVKIAFNLSCGDGTNVALGENQQTFMEDRSVTLQRYLAAAPYNLNGAAPYDFQIDETTYGPYRIIEPGAAGFNAGGPYQNYYANYISSIWSFNGITIPLAGPNGSGLGANPDLSAAIFRHTAPISGTREFNAAGALTNQGMWGNPASFYQQEPYDHYAQWIEAQAINMQQYAFPYNDAGGYSSDIGCANPKTLLVAIGW